jgi:hypothetical protein
MKEVCEQAQKSYGYGFSEQADHTKRRFPYAWQEVVGGFGRRVLAVGRYRGRLHGARYYSIRNLEADFNFMPPVVSTVGPTDPDVTAALTAFSTVSPFERFVDFNASGNYTPGEPSISKLLLVLY